MTVNDIKQVLDWLPGHRLPNLTIRRLPCTSDPVVFMQDTQEWLANPSDVEYIRQLDPEAKCITHAWHIKIISSDFGGLKFERAFISQSFYVVGGVRSQEEGMSAHAIVSGIECRIGTKISLVEAGLAFLQPVEYERVATWPVKAVISVDGHPNDTRPGFTDHPEIVRAARRYRQLREQGRRRIGMEL